MARASVDSVESTAECYLPVGDSQVRPTVLADRFQTDPLHQHHSPAYLENDPVTWVDEGKMGTVCYKMRGGDGELLWRLGSRSKEERYQPSLRYWNPTSLTGWKLGRPGSPRWVRENPLISHGPTGEFRHRKLLRAHDRGTKGNTGKAREPSRFCWPRGARES